jgi:hypothetical protein
LPGGGQADLQSYRQKTRKKTGLKRALPLQEWAIRHLPDNQLPYRI